MKKWPKILLQHTCLVMLGISLALAFAPFHIFPFAILAPAGLLMLILDKTAKQAACLGFSFGLGFFGAGVYWVFIAIHHYGDVNLPISILITSALVAFLALYPAVACYVTNRYFPSANTSTLVAAFPAVWVFVEWFRSWLFTGFPWLLVGYSQTNSPLIGYAPIFSVYGCSFAALVSAGLLVSAYKNYQSKCYRALYLSLFMMLTLWVTGGLLSEVHWTKKMGNSLQISLVQGNIPQSLKWSANSLHLSFERYTELTKPLWKKDQIIIWPEAAIPMTLQEAAPFIDAMDKKAKESDATLILGIPILDNSSHGYYNAVITLGKNKGVYLKRRLVPFGEYVPLEKLSSRVFNFIHVPMSETLEGNPNQALLQVGNIKLLTAICFEIAFPDLVFTQDKQMGFLLTVTNDAWFNDSIAKTQHIQMAQMHAIELGRPVVFASNDGITAIIDAQGKIEKTAPQHTPYVLSSTIQPTTGLTPWMQRGMDPILIILILSLLIAKKTHLSEKSDGRTIQSATH